MTEPPAHMSERRAYREGQRATSASTPRVSGLAIVGAAMSATLVVGISASQLFDVIGQLPAVAATTHGAQSAGSIQLPDDSDAADSDLPAAREGVVSQSALVRFIPTSVALPSGESAPVQTAQTVNGELVVPQSAAEVGWWDGSAYAGDPFGHTVLAGHVDDPSGPGFFGELLSTTDGDIITVTDGDEDLRYQVTSINEIDKDALASSTDTFDQTGEHQLVMITCSGPWQADRGGYANNTVVIAERVTTT